MTVSKIPYIFDIKRYAINDGPGIRVTLFFKGCSLQCRWCHNPEGLSNTQERIFISSRCIGCNVCIDICPNRDHHLKDKMKGYQIGGKALDREICDMCGKCIEICPTKAMTFAGKRYSIDQLIEIIDREQPFFDNSEGGVTICGGEPLIYSQYLLTLLQKLKERSIHTAVDTTLFSDLQTVKDISEYCDLFLVDLKIFDNNKHREYTGVDNRIIKSNIEYLTEIDKEFWIRIPLINGVNCDNSNIEACAEYLSKLNWRGRHINLLKFHDSGIEKYNRIGRLYNRDQLSMNEPSESCIESIIKIFNRYNLYPIIGG